MTIQELLRLARSRLSALNGEYSTAALTGNIEEMPRLEALILETQSTIDKLSPLV